MSSESEIVTDLEAGKTTMSEAKHIAVASVLDLLSAQVKSALADFECPQRQITSKFVESVDKLDDITLRLGQADSERCRKALQAELQEMRKSAQRVIYEFQAFDKIEQRLRHVQDSLNLISDYALDGEARSEMSIDAGLLERMKSFYSLEHELTLHQMMEGGSSRNQLLRSCNSDVPKGTSSDIELF